MIPVHVKAYSIQHFVSDLRQLGGFLRFPPPIKHDRLYDLNYIENGI
jgi:hypothetical protein